MHNNKTVCKPRLIVREMGSTILRSFSLKKEKQVNLVLFVGKCNYFQFIALNSILSY